MTFGFYQFCTSLDGHKDSNGNDWFSDNPNVALKMAVISPFNCISDHSDENDIFPMRPAPANLVLVSPLGMQNVDSDDQGKHTASFAYVL